MHLCIVLVQSASFPTGPPSRFASKQPISGSAPGLFGYMTLDTEARGKRPRPVAVQMETKTKTRPRATGKPFQFSETKSRVRPKVIACRICVTPLSFQGVD